MTDEVPAAVRAALEELHGRWPQRMVPDLERITDLLDILGSPQRAFPSIHLTGTNGKTSTARMIDGLLRAHDLRTGRYTSPDLQSVAERISIGGDQVSLERFAALHDEIFPFVQMVDERHPDRMTYFEVLTAMAFAAFADAPVDVGVIEVGLGGRWDATNVIDAPVAVLTPISLDHTALLGPDVESIATEKAAIITTGSVAVVGEQPLEALEVILRRCSEVGATVAREGLEFGVVDRNVAVGGQQISLQGLAGVYGDIFLPLHGAHQAHNAAIALAAVEAFLGRGPDNPLDAEVVRAGFAITDSPGRLEIIRSGPTILLDGAHNPASATALVEALGEAFAFAHLVGVVGILADKDVEQVLAILEPVLATVVCTTGNSPRALPADEIAELAVEIFSEDRVLVEPRLADAVSAAVELVEERPELVGTAGGGVLITGSLVTVGEARSLLFRG